MLREGLYQDLTAWKVNLDYLEEQDYFKIFEHEQINVPSFQVDDLSRVVNYIIRTVIVEDKSLDRQISFIKDTRNKRRCTYKQLQYFDRILGRNYYYNLNDKQKKYLANQPVCVLSKLIDLFKNTEFFAYRVFNSSAEVYRP